ncbi:hypothetical protein GCM10009425_45260 [Pseudomonas asuensis]|uniref:histidine kinase n=2 Tax=Pseudomonas asuensis TaxID=1825787 RepID=A0ABQ2H493_9PSED|nr:hypothetical protein GCM10009425_45260 [Pseudomonas asuensis]
MSMGRPLLEVWEEAREELAPIVDSVYNGTSIHMDDITLTMHRHGYPEETHFAFSYTPVRDEYGQVAGFFCPCVETTAEVLAERRHRKEIERQRHLFDQAPGFIAILSGPEHVFEFTNATHARLFGNRHFIGKTIREAYPDLQDGRLFQWMDKVFETGERFVATQLPFRLHGEGTSDSTERYLNFIYEPIKDETGKVTGIFVEGYDITEQYQAEQALRASELQFTALVQAIPNGVWSATPDGALSWASDWLVAYCGAESSAHLARDWLEWVHPEDRPAVGRLWSSCIQSGMLYETKMRLRRFDGAYRWHIAKAVPVHGVGEEILWWIGTTTDIHEQTQATEELQQLNITLEHSVAVRTLQYDRVWRNSRDLLAVTGADGVFSSVNPAWKEILGYDQVQLEGQSLYDFVWHEDIAETRQAIHRAASSDHLTSFVNRYCHRDGTPRWISWHSSADGDACYFYGRHITAEKEQQQALQQAGEQLRQAQKMEAVGQLTGGIGHDFNNLLGGIIASLGMLKKHVAYGRTDKLERYTGIALESAQRAAALTHRLLAFSRRQSLTPKPVDAIKLISDIEVLLRRSIGPSHILRIESEQGLWLTICDPHQLESAVLNLVINARDAMGEGGELHIRLENCLSAPGVVQGEYVRIALTDNGAGMPADVLERAIEPFFTTKPMGQGTGLGLSMVYGFARQSEGQLEISSTEGKGTTVSLYLPRYEGKLYEDTTELLGNPQRMSIRETVLLVEDDPAIRELIPEMLEDLGYFTLVAGDGYEGLEILKSHKGIDLLITDIGLPGLNGRDLAAQALRMYPSLKVLFITGYDQSVTLQKSLHRSGVELMTKPFTIAALASKITSMTEGQ